jgi:hypothetical protein
MFQFILEKLRTVWFTYADVSCGAYPLDTIDTIAENGSTDTTSALYLVVNGVIKIFCHNSSNILLNTSKRNQKII